MTDIQQMADTILSAGNIQWFPYSLPGFEGEYEAALINTDLKKAPFIALLKMKPGARIAAHKHPKLIESVYVAEGVMTNKGETLPAGSFLIHGPGVTHGPHYADRGCTLMFIQYPVHLPEDGVYIVGPDDSILM